MKITAVISAVLGVTFLVFLNKQVNEHEEILRQAKWDR